MIQATMVAGEDFEVQFEVTVNGVPEDITDYAAKSEMRKDAKKGRLLESWTDASPDLSRLNEDGIVTIKIPGGTTKNYSFDQAFIDLLLEKSDGGRRSSTLRIELERGVTE